MENGRCVQKLSDQPLSQLGAYHIELEAPYGKVSLASYHKRLSLENAV